MLSLALVLVTFCTNYLVYALSDPRDPDEGLNVIELIQRYNYPVERHRNIQTSDGYLLEMHRIPWGLKSGPADNKPAILLMHGLLNSSADWVNSGLKSLAFLLADLGYDVWMGNARGNTWSRKHISLDPDGFHDREKFWAFSWHDIGVRDLPAKIDYIQSVTNQEKIFYIGHSQGTTSFFVMCAERPEYNYKIRLMIALSPTAYLSHTTSPLLRFLATFDGTIELLASLIGLYEFLPNNEFLSSLGQVTCRDGSLFQEVCAETLFLIAGFDSEQLNRTRIPVYVTNTPAGAATKQLIHYGQNSKSKKFRHFDYGLDENLIKYGSLTPPDYRINNIRTPVALFYGNNDWINAVVDVNQLAGELPNLVYQCLVPHDKFNHLDPLWAIDVIPLLYNKVFHLLEQY